MITRLEPTGNLRFFDLMGLPRTSVNLLHEDGLVVVAADDQRHLLDMVGQRETETETDGEEKLETRERKPQDRHELAMRLTELITARLIRRTS